MIAPWFKDAKLGIFVHWGIYAVDGVTESWSWYTGMPKDQYFGQLAGFRAERYDPEVWAELFARTGADYAVMTAKHHDGVALWDTAANDLSVPKATPAGRDVLTPWVEAVRGQGMRVGIYFSHLDWAHPDYASIYPTRGSEVQEDPKRYENRLGYPEPGAEDAEAWARFIRFHRAQMDELQLLYRPDLWWFDGEWERDPEQFDMEELSTRLRTANPDVVANARLLGYGDYATPEQGMPMRPPAGEWEFCMTMNDSWGWQGKDTNHKSVRQIVRIFCEVVGMGGRLLLDVGPTAAGEITPEQTERLEGLAAWNMRHREAIWGTVAGLPPGHHYGASTQSEDGQTIFLMCFDEIRDDLHVRGVFGKPERVTAVGTRTELGYKVVGGAEWEGTPGTLVISVPPEAQDTTATVLRLDYAEPVRLYSGSGRAT